MDIIIAHATKNPCYKAAEAMTPKGIVVHSTGANNPYLKRYVDAPDKVGVNVYGNHWNRADRNGCVHAFIGYDKHKQVRVAELLPLNICCWGIGRGTKGSFNYSPAYLQFEMCEDGLTDAAYFKKMWDVSVEYCVYLCKKFKLNPLGKNVIVGHYEAHKLGYGSNHADPKHWFSKHGKTMDDFRKAVKAGMEDKPVQKVEKETITYTVKSGDSWWKISANVLGKGSRYKELQALNPGKKNLHPGDVIIVGKSEKPASTAKKTYTVQKGDSWWKISAAVLGKGSRYQELKALNPGKESLYPGDVIIVAK